MSTTISGRSLDEFPTEIKRMILRAIPNISALKTLVWSSPAYHEVYIYWRREILASVPENNIGAEIWCDVLTRFNARYPGIEMSQQLEGSWITGITYAYENDVKNVIGDYQADLIFTSHPSSHDLTTHITIAKFHQKALFLASKSCNHVLSVHYSSLNEDLCLENTSKHETHQVFRAFYRLETFYLLFGNVRKEASAMWENSSIRSRVYTGDSSADIPLVQVYHDIFEPCKLEEMACVRDFYTVTIIQI